MFADQRVLRGVSATLSFQNVNSDGTAVAPAGAVTVGVVNSAGETVIAAGTATAGSDAAPRTVALPAASNMQLDRLTATWTDAGDSSVHQTYIEVVGGYYFSLAEARAADAALANDTKFPDPAVLACRQAVEEEFEEICSVAFVPRFAVDEVTCDIGLRLQWAQVREIRSVETWNGTAWTDYTSTTDLLVRGRILQGSFCVGGRYRVAYAHGYDRPPSEVKAVALQRLLDRAVTHLTGIPDRATSFSVAEGGTYRLDQAGVRKTGMPQVDAALARWDHSVWAA